jgi:phage gpG-like protein
MREFKSAGAFAAHLRALAAREIAVEQGALRDAGRLVQHTAHDFIGEYQPQEGPFPAWAPLAETTLHGARDQMGRWHPGKVDLGFAPPDNSLLRTGDLQHAIELSVDHREAVVGVADQNAGDGTPGNPFRNLGDVAIDLEFGTVHMPARSFLGRALFVNIDNVVRIIGEAVYRAVAGLPQVSVGAHPHRDDPPF